MATIDSKPITDSFAKLWTEKVEKVVTLESSKPVAKAMKEAFLSFIPTLVAHIADGVKLQLAKNTDVIKKIEDRMVGEAEDNKVNVDRVSQGVAKMQAKLEEDRLGGNHFDQDRRNFTSNKICQDELTRVKDSLIIDVSQGNAHKLTLDMKKKIVKDMNEQIKLIKVAPGAEKPVNITLKECDWKTIRSPKDGNHKDSVFHRLTMHKKYSKKAFFQMLRLKGSTDYDWISAKSEFPQFLRQAQNNADFLGAMMRRMSQKSVKTRSSLNMRHACVELQVNIRRENNRPSFVTIATSAEKNVTDSILLIPAESVIERGSDETEAILQKLVGYYKPPE